MVYGQVIGVGQCQGGSGQVGLLLSVHRRGEGRLLRDGCGNGRLKTGLSLIFPSVVRFGVCFGEQRGGRTMGSKQPRMAP